MGEACTFVLDTRPRAPSKAYVQKLESQVKGLEEAVRTVSMSLRPLSSQDLELTRTDERLYHL